MNERLKALEVVLKDLQENHDFGSNFQFWVTQASSELEDCLSGILTDSEIRDIAIKIVRRISQDT